MHRESNGGSDFLFSSGACRFCGPVAEQSLWGRRCYMHHAISLDSFF